MFKYFDCISFIVMPREGHGSRNSKLFHVFICCSWSCPARGMGVEIYFVDYLRHLSVVMPREGHGSRNTTRSILTGSSVSCPARGMGVEIHICLAGNAPADVMPREGHGSRNLIKLYWFPRSQVMPREGHGSRNSAQVSGILEPMRHAPRGAWE